MGENGAGKSTLALALAGGLTLDSGVIERDGQPLTLPSPRAAVRAGIGMVHQHFTLVGNLNGTENIALWSMPGAGRLHLDQVRERAQALADQAGLDVALDEPVETLSVGARQRLEVLKLLYSDPDVLVLDEPTAVLAPSEVETLFRTLRVLAGEGRAVLLIAHKLDEVLSVADRITVLGNGRTVLEAERDAVDAEALVKAMIGTEAAVPDSVLAPPTTLASTSGRGGDEVVTSRDLTSVDLTVRRGEIVGIAGVEGNGQRALASELVGLGQSSMEDPFVVGYIPADRTMEGVIGDFTLVENVALGFHDHPATGGGPWLDWDRVRGRAEEVIERFGVKVGSADARVRTLSGGNQQKVVVGRELSREPDLVVAENPTRGLDVAAQAFVHAELRRLRDTPTLAAAPGVVLLSTDLDEILMLSDRVLVMRRGALIPVPPEQANRDDIGRLMLAGGAT